MKMTLKKLLVLFYLIIPLSIFSQIDTTFLKKTELRMMNHFKSLSISKSDDKQNLINDSILNEFKKLLNEDISFHYAFDSLKTIGKINSDNDQIRIYSWNVPYLNGTHHISGIIQYRVNKDSLSYLILNDCTYEIENTEQQILSPEKWYGAMYYEILGKKINKHQYYFLMGYHPYDLYTNIKVIDVFYFNESGDPKFGKPLFNINNIIKKRVIFEYNERASMALHYNKKLKMIVFHRLVPFNHKYQGNPFFYGPDSSFDGLQFKNGTWNFVEEVDVRNE